MKRLLLLAATMALVSCGDPGAAPTPAPGVIEPQAVAQAGGPRTAVNVHHGSGFITEFNPETKRVTKWGPRLNLGDVVFFLEEFEDLIVDDQGNRWPVVKIRRGDNTEGWMFRAYAVPDSLPGVIINYQATIYRQADLAAPTAFYLSQGDFIAVSTEAVSGGFIKFTHSNPAGRLTVNQFLRADQVSTAENDVQSARFLRLAAAARTNRERRELLTTAVTTFPSDTFLPIAQAELAITEAEFTQERVNEATTALVDVDVLNTPFDYGSIVGRLSKGTQTTIIRKLSKGDQTWYEINNPAGFVPGWFNVSANVQEQDAPVAQ